MTLITDSESLAAFCRRQEDTEFVTVDTEFLRDNSYWPKLCLVQIAGPEEAVAVDTLAEGLDIDPLVALLCDETILKVFHSGRQDLEIFYHLIGRLPAPIFDTQVAAMVCGFGDSVGYETLARQLAGARIDKASRFTDWSRRPLTERQIDYALADVTHLRKVYRKLKKRLGERADWLTEEMAVLTDPETYELRPEAAWQRLKTRSRDKRHLAVVRALAAWRESEAQARDLPRGRVLRDDQVLDIAAHRPKSAQDLARTRSLGRKFADSRQGQAVLKTIADALALPDEALPEPPPQRELPNGLGPLVDLLKVLLRAKCEEHDVALKLVASSSDLEQIAADDKAEVRALAGWRREIFGEDALALKHGRLALGARDNAVELVELEPEE
ncbi:MAG: ribonuclease D [Pseudomonadota bacterium]